MKNGWKTTEFWVTALTVLSIAAGWISGYVPSEAAVIAQALAAGLYATARGLGNAGAADSGALRTETLDALGGLLPGGGNNGLPGGLHHGAAPAASTPSRPLIDDPRVDVRRVERGAPSPLTGVVMTEYTYRALIDAARSATGERD